MKCSLLTAALGLLSCGSAQATLYWDANTANGTKVFEGLDLSPSTSTVKVVNDPLGQFGSVYQYHLTDTFTSGKERCESSGTVQNGVTFRVSYNTAYYIGWRAMWNPMPINGSWVALFQMHGYGVSGQGAPLVLRTENGDGNLYLQANANGINQDIWHGQFKLGVWQGFVLHVFLSTNWSQGYVELWVNGVQQTFYNGQTRWYGPTWDNVDGKWQDSYNKLKWGCYRSGSLDGTGDAYAYMSAGKVGSAYSDVDPGIGGGGGGGGLSGINQLQNEASGMALTVSGASKSNGAAVIQWAYNGGANEQWTFVATSNGYYQIKNVNSALDAVVQSASTANGAKIVQWSFGSSGDDQWQPQQNSDGSYTFVNRKSGLVLEDPGNSTTQGTQMDQWSSNGGSNQKWKLISE
ncbi:MAG: RICIN domain-containing protein [Verrucomicrobiota bacterium]|nr:RICIN domain-containing protein [Verrucomicrobiota bacterium]